MINTQSVEAKYLSKILLTILNQDETISHAKHAKKRFRLYWSPESGLWIKHSDHTHHLTDSSGNVLEDAAFQNEPDEHMDSEAEEVQLPCEY